MAKKQRESVKVRNLEARLISVSNANADLQDEIEQDNRTIKGLCADLAGTERQLNEAQDTVVIVRKDNSALRDDVKKLQQQLDEAERTILNLNSEANDLATEVDELKTKNRYSDGLEAKVKQLSERVENQCEIAERRNATIDRQTAVIECLQKTIVEIATANR